MGDNKAAYTGKDYPRHTNGPWGYEDFALSTRTVKPGPSGRGYKVLTATAVMALVSRF